MCPSMHPRLRLRLEQRPTRSRPTTGRYETREELVAQVWAWYGTPGTTQAQIARICQVSAGTVANILKEKP